MSEICSGPVGARKMRRIPAMSLAKSLLFFFIPALFFWVLFWEVIPFLDLLGNSLFVTFLIGFGSPYLILLLLSLRFYSKEARSFGESTLKERFRLDPISGKSWLWTALLCLVLYASYQQFAPVVIWSQEYFPSPPKSWVLMQNEDPTYFMEVKYSWWVFSGYLLFSIVRTFGTEFWFRGYILPRQEIAFGNWTWLLHGILYTLFYVFMPWNLIGIFIPALAIAFVAQRVKNTWPGIIAQMVCDVPLLYSIATKIH